MIKRLLKYPLPVSIFIFIVLYILLFPFYKFIFDQDSIGYSAIAERVASGDLFKSINGLWSPLSAWLVVPLIKMGIDPIIGFKYINGVTGVLLLIATWQLLKKFAIANSLKAIILYTCVSIFLSYCFYELCADFLLLLFFTVYLIQVCSDDFFENKKRIFISAFIAVFAYLAKAYFFPFFLLHFIIINFYYYRQSFAADKLKKLLQNLLLGLISFFAFASPWIYALSAKYHYLTYSTAGKYNTYMHLYNGPGEYPSILIPPPYSNSYNSWEDPLQPFMFRFSAASSIIGQLKLLLHNIMHSIPLFAEISFLSLVIIATIFFLSLSKRSSIQLSPNIFICGITAALMPMGYFLFHLETRFIWILSILCLIMGGYIISELVKRFQLSQKQKIFIVLIFAVSFLIGPLLSLKNNIYNGKEAYTIAAVLKDKHVTGKVTSNIVELDRFTTLLMSNVIAKNQFYNYSRNDFSETDLLETIKQFNIDYYMFSYTGKSEKDIFLSSLLCKSATEVYADFYPGIILLKLK